MARSWVLVAALWSLGVSAQAFELEAEVGTSVLWGRAHELVLRDGSYDDLISRLDWDIPPSLGVEVGVTAHWSPLTNTEVRLALAHPLSTGVMVDQDWDTGTYDYARSEHTALMVAHWSAEVAQSVTWSSWKTSVGMTYRFTSWEAWNGEGTYHYTNGTTSEITFSGLGIAYRQQWLIPFLGLEWTAGDEGSVQVTPGLRFGPYSYCYDMDNHFLRDLTFLDYSWGGWYTRTSLEVLVPTPSAWSWGVRFGGDLHWGAQGTTLVTEPKQSSGGVSYESYEADEKPGAWFWEAKVVVFVRN